MSTSPSWLREGEFGPDAVGAWGCEPRTRRLPGSALAELDWSAGAARSSGLRSETEVELWRVDLGSIPSEGVAWLASMLADDERERAERFRFETDRRRFVVGRAALRWLLAGHLQVSPAAITFCYGAAGKPSLRNPAESGGLHFNVTHSGDAAIIAVTRAGEIGVDVELVRDLPDWEGVAELVFEPEQIVALRAHVGEGRREAFFQEWTRAEAIAKAHGMGLGAAKRGGNFSVRTFSSLPGWVVSIAAPPTVNSLRCRSWCAVAGSPTASIDFHISGASIAADSAVLL